MAQFVIVIDTLPDVAPVKIDANQFELALPKKVGCSDA
jgi:hypothetical protein